MVDSMTPRQRYVWIALLGFTFGMVSDTLGFVFNAWLYVHYAIPAVAWPLAMVLYYALRPRIPKPLAYLALGIYALWTEMMAIIFGAMSYVIADVPNMITIGSGWMPRAIFVWPVITVAFYYMAVDLTDYLRNRMNHRLAEVTVVGLMALYSTAFTMLYMRVLVFVL